jgi:hypothetical protein
MCRAGKTRFVFFALLHAIKKETHRQEIVRDYRYIAWDLVYYYSGNEIVRTPVSFRRTTQGEIDRPV